MPSDRGARPCRLFAPELCIVVHDFTHQLFDQLLTTTPSWLLVSSTTVFATATITSSPSIDFDVLKALGEEPIKMGLNDPSKKASILRVVDVIVVNGDLIGCAILSVKGRARVTVVVVLGSGSEPAKPEITLGAPARHHAKVGT